MWVWTYRLSKLSKQLSRKPICNHQKLCQHYFKKTHVKLLRENVCQCIDCKVEWYQRTTAFLKIHEIGEEIAVEYDYGAVVAWVCRDWPHNVEELLWKGQGQLRVRYPNDRSHFLGFYAPEISSVLITSKARYGNLITLCPPFCPRKLPVSWR